MTESIPFTSLRLDLAGFSGKRCKITRRAAGVAYGTISVNKFGTEGGVNLSYPWWFNSESGPFETYTSQGTVMKNSPHPNDILSIEESVEAEQDQHSELEDRVAQLESKVETLLRHFHELSSEL